MANQLGQVYIQTGGRIANQQATVVITSSMRAHFDKVYSVVKVGKDWMEDYLIPQQSTQ
jgi:hypothetical protein